MFEQWKEVPGYDGVYEVSSFGRIRSYIRPGKSLALYGKSSEPHIINSTGTKKGYRRAEFWRNGKKKRLLLHRLIGQAFLPNPDNLPVINHKDGNKANNHKDNLEWCTYKHNAIHAYETGLRVYSPKRKAA